MSRKYRKSQGPGSNNQWSLATNCGSKATSEEEARLEVAVGTEEEGGRRGRGKP